jgi:hypothetical protein
MVFIMAFVATVMFANATQAACSAPGTTSTANSKTELLAVEGISFVAVTVTLLDENGTPVCGEEVELTTTRNFWGSDANIDDVWTPAKVTNNEGQAVFIISTKSPSGTTLMVAARGHLLREQRPFLWGESYNTLASSN